MDEQNIRYWQNVDEEENWTGPAHLDPVMRRRRAMLAGREPRPVLPQEPEKVYHCNCGKALDPLEPGMLCGGCR